MLNLGIIIVNWNSTDLLENCLKSIKKNLTVKNYKIFIVDNASSDKKIHKLQDKFKEIDIIINKQNLGFGFANNQVLKTLKSKYALILNPDTEITEGSIEALIKALESSPKIGAVGPKLLDKNGQVQKAGFYRRYPSLIQTLLFYTDLHRLADKNKYLVSKYWESEVTSGVISEVDQIPGACLLIKMDLFKRIGFFDQSFPFWFEDVDVCFELKKLNYKLLYIPESRVVHIGGTSWAKWSDVSSRELRFLKSMFIFFDKHYSLYKRIMVRLIIFSSLIFMSISRMIMQLFSENKDRGKFINIKLNVLKGLFLDSPTLPNL